MRKVTGLALLVVGAVVAPLSMAQAAEVLRLPALNQSASAFTFDPNTGASTSLFVQREKVNKGGGPVDSISFFVSQPNGDFFLGVGTLPKGALHMDAKNVSVEVDVDDITFTTELGTIPDGVITADWKATDVERESGSTKLDMGNIHVNFVGTRTFAPASATGSVLGNSLAGASAEIDSISQSTIIITKD